MKSARTIALVFIFVTSAWTAARGAIILETLPIGNPGNPGEISGDDGALGPMRLTGEVDYTFDMGKYEITAGQYTTFLNAVAASDPYALYHSFMGQPPGVAQGCQILRSGSPGSYTYSVAADWADRPVNHVGWAATLRFANWMTNGQPTGPEGLATTEDGSYFINGASGSANLGLITRKPNATWVLPTEDEWYKAAYHKNDGPTGNYFTYPTKSDLSPNNLVINPDPGNSANFFTTAYTIGNPYYRTPVGEFENSSSPYGTFDQGGNIFEYTQTLLFSSGNYFSILRGGSFNALLTTLNKNNRSVNGNVEDGGGQFAERYMGFRLAQVPEPTTLGMAGIALLVLRRRGRRSR